jgi:hypothetical protein
MTDEFSRQGANGAKTVMNPEVCLTKPLNRQERQGRQEQDLEIACISWRPCRFGGWIC